MDGDLLLKEARQLRERVEKRLDEREARQKVLLDRIKFLLDRSDAFGSDRALTEAVRLLADEVLGEQDEE